MIDVLGLVAIGVATFAATNIDDIFVLLIFFSSLSFPVRHTILGQYRGIGLLIAISAESWEANKSGFYEDLEEIS